MDGAPALTAPLTHVLSAPGKRIRSIVTLAAACLDPRHDHPVPAAFDAAAAIEAIHEATLLHDDILDGSEVRRGQASVAAQFGVRTAVFVGAFLAGRGLASVARQCEQGGVAPDFGLLQELAEAEILESLPPSEDATARLARLTRVADGKTGALFRLALRLGAGVAAAAGAELPTPRVLDGLATALGRAFQIRDDVLDVRCDRSLRRPGMSDVMCGLLNWPVHFWVEASAVPANAIARLRGCTGDPERAAALLDEVLASGAVARACLALEGELDTAAGLAASLPHSAGRSVLLRIAGGLRLT